MYPARQLRQSCEACRTRKLKCSGERTGCSRCISLTLTCHFHDKGAPGRPRKRLQTGVDEPQRSRPRAHRIQQQGDLAVRHHQRDGRRERTCGQQPVDSAASVLSNGTTDVNSASSATAPAAVAHDNKDLEAIASLLECYETSADFTASFEPTGQLSAMAMDFFGPCLSNHTHGRDWRQDLSGTASVASLQAPAPSPPQPLPQQQQTSCNCAEDALSMVRNLQRRCDSHDKVRTLRAGTNIVERLLICQACYDTSKPPRLTIQNVLLVGRLAVAIASGYLRYLTWLKASCGSLMAMNESEPIYLATSLEAGPSVDFSITGDMLHNVVTQGIRKDIARLTALGELFEIRQYNRHLVGHEACPDPEARCWKEESGVDIDPSDICPQSASAKALIPCYRVVEEVRARFKQIADAVA